MTRATPDHTDPTRTPLPDPSSPRRVLTFRGTRREFLAYLADCENGLRLRYPDPEDYDWELTAAIARHPAGKGLGLAGDRGEGDRPAGGSPVVRRTGFQTQLDEARRRGERDRG